MDIEGSEPLALRGAQALIDRSPKLKIVTEWSLKLMSARADVGRYVDWLTDRRFRFWLIGAGPKLTSVDPSGVLAATALRFVYVSGRASCGHIDQG
jgi:hypothetical protein